jgi:hypothetical protein
MADGISFFSNDDLKEHINLVMSQTNYTKEQTIEKLKLFNCDYMRVLKDYMGIPEKKTEPKIKSVNQEIYKQIRTKFDSSMKEYRDAHPVNMEQLIDNFNESDELEKNKIKLK